MRQTRLGFAKWALFLGLYTAIATPACGAKVIVDGDSGGGGSGGEGGSATTTGQTTFTTTTGQTTFTTTSTSSTTTTTSSTTTSTTTTTTTTPTVTGGETLVEVPLGQVDLDSPFTFEIPPNTLGFTIVASPSGGGDGSIGVEELFAPDGTQIVNDFSLGPQNQLFFYVNQGIVAASVPQSDDPQAMPVQPGKWSAQLSNFGPGSNAADVTVWIRQTVDGQFHGGVLDVNVFLVDGVADPDQIDIDLIDAYTDWAGVTLGTVSYFELSPAFEIIDENNFYEALNQTAPASGKPALNLLYVSLLTGQLDGAAGVSSGLPGVAIQHGTNASGIIAMHFNDPFDVTVLKHEAGHFGGLFHTSEFDPGNGDFLSDTPLCNNVNNQGVNCPDYPNIMFPTGGDGLLFSDMQIRVLQGSDLYRGIFEPGAAPAKPFFLAAPDSAGASAFRTADLTGSAPSARAAARVRPSAAPWAAGLPQGTAEALSGLACPHGTTALQGAWNATLTALSPLSDSALLAVASNPAAPSSARTRAVQALDARTPSASQLAAIADLAASDTAPSVVRVAAIRAVSRSAPATRATLKSRLLTAPAQVSRVAGRLL